MPLQRREIVSSNDASSENIFASEGCQIVKVSEVRTKHSLYRVIRRVRKRIAMVKGLHDHRSFPFPLAMESRGCEINI